MTIIECNKQLRVLTDAHENYTISMSDYRQQRKQIFDRLDKDMNGTDAFISPIEQVIEPPLLVKNEMDNRDKTQPYFSAKLGKCISFLKGKNER